MVSTQVSRWPRESAASNARDMARARRRPRGGRSARSGRGSPDGVARPPATAAAGCAVAAAAQLARALALAAVLRRAHANLGVVSAAAARGGGPEAARTATRFTPSGVPVGAARRRGTRLIVVDAGGATGVRHRARAHVASRGDAERVTRRGGDASRDARAADAAAPRAARGRHVGEPTTTTARPSIPPDGVARRFPARTLAPEPLARLQPRRRAPLAASATPDGDATAEAPTLAVIVREKSVWMRLSEPPFYPFSWFRDVASKSSFSFQILSMSVGQRKRDESKESSSRGRPLASRPAFLECRTVRGGTTSRNGQLLSAFSEQPRRAEGTSPRASHTHER